MEQGVGQAKRRAMLRLTSPFEITTRAAFELTTRLENNRKIRARNLGARWPDVPTPLARSTETNFAMRGPAGDRESWVGRLRRQSAFAEVHRFLCIYGPSQAFARSARAPKPRNI